EREHLVAVVVDRGADVDPALFRVPRQGHTTPRSLDELVHVDLHVDEARRDVPERRADLLAHEGAEQLPHGRADRDGAVPPEVREGPRVAVLLFLIGQALSQEVDALSQRLTLGQHVLATLELDVILTAESPAEPSEV